MGGLKHQDRDVPDEQVTAVAASMDGERRIWCSPGGSMERSEMGAGNGR